MKSVGLTPLFWLCAAKMFEAGNFSKELFLKHAKGVLSAVVKLWVQEAQDKGYFVAKVHKQFGFDIKVDIPYIRWGQAWMFRAVAAMVAMSLSCKMQRK